MSEPIVVIDGMREIIEKDLEKHKSLLVRTQEELVKFKQARKHEIDRKKHWNGLIGGGKFNDERLKASIQDIRINIQHFSDKIKLANEKRDHHQLIIDTLTEQLADQVYLEQQAELYYQQNPEERPDGNEHKLGN